MAWFTNVCTADRADLVLIAMGTAIATGFCTGVVTPLSISASLMSAGVISCILLGDAVLHGIPSGHPPERSNAPRSRPEK